MDPYVYVVFGVTFYSRLKSWSMQQGGFVLGVPSFFGLGLEDGHAPTFWLLQQCDLA